MTIRGKRLTINILVPKVLESKLDNFIGRSEDSTGINVAAEGIPGVPS